MGWDGQRMGCDEMSDGMKGNLAQSKDGMDYTAKRGFVGWDEKVGTSHPLFVL